MHEWCWEVGEVDRGDFLTIADDCLGLRGWIGRTPGTLSGEISLPRRDMPELVSAHAGGSFGEGTRGRTRSGERGVNVSGPPGKRCGRARQSLTPGRDDTRAAGRTTHATDDEQPHAHTLAHAARNEPGRARTATRRWSRRGTTDWRKCSGWLFTRPRSISRCAVSSKHTSSCQPARQAGWD